MIRFTSDIFHPLVTPLTTYTYSSTSSEIGTVSARDEERLPPGGFSLKHGFPYWFKTAASTVASSDSSFRDANHPTQLQKAVSSIEQSSYRSLGSTKAAKPQDNTDTPFSGIAQVLEYIKTTFADADTLDSVPLDGAGNPGAWKAWQAHRKRTLHISPADQNNSSLSPSGRLNDKTPMKFATGGRTKQPEEWSWDGVWQDRVRKGINASISDQALFGNSVGDDPVYPPAVAV